MKAVDMIKESELNKELITATASAVTGITFYMIGRAIEKRTGKHDIATPALVLGSALSPLAIKLLLK